MLEDDPMHPHDGLTEDDTQEEKTGQPIEVSDGLQSFLKEEYDRCFDTTLEADRATALKRYNGEPYGDEEEGWSQVVSRDTAKAIDYMTNSILRTIVSGDRVVEFVHKTAELATEATETIHHLFLDEQDGYRVLHDWLKAGLLEKNAVAMTFIDHVPPKRRMFEGVSEMALTLAMQQGANLIEVEHKGDGPDGPIYDATELSEQPPRFTDSAVPNEEFYCSVDARTIDEAMMKGRRVLRLVSDIAAEGFDPDELGASANSSMATDPISLARNDNRSQWFADRGDKAREIWWHEEFVRFDENGDGIAELLYIRRTEDFTIFHIQEMEDVTDHPFEDWCPFPMPHKRIGQSLADKVMPYERINTVLTRQTLDGIYLANMPQTYLHEDAIGTNTIEDILNPRPGSVVRWKGNIAPVERQASFSPADGFQMIEFIKGELEELTGITRLNQGLDGETLNKTATGQSMLQAQGQQMEEYLAHNFGNALARLFTKKARLLKRYGRPITVPIDGEYKEVDPRKWPEDMIARPRIGLGASRKEQQLAYLLQIQGMQKGLIEGGKANLVSDANIYNAAKAFVNNVKLGDVSEWFTDPMQTDPQTGQKVPKPVPPKPDPAMAKVEADAQMQAAKMQSEQQMQAAKLQADAAQSQQAHQLKTEEAALKLQLMQQESAAKLDLEREKAALEMQLAREKAAMEMELAREQMAAEAALEQQRMHVQAATDAHIAENRPGGELDK